MNNEEQIKHLEVVQSIIGRMASQSFLIKGWTITISLDGFGFYIDKKDGAFLLLILFSTLIFWVLDAYYVSAERAFRSLYKDVSNRKRYM